MRPLSPRPVGRLAVVFAVLAAAVPAVPAAAQTHLGVPVEDLVTLRTTSLENTMLCGSDFQNLAFFRLQPDGSLESQPFVVPAGRALVVTDAEIVATPGNAVSTWSSETALSVGLKLPGQGETLLVSPVPILDDFSGSSTVLGADVHLTAGVVAGEGSELCAFARQETSGTTAVARVRSAMVHGYLTTPGQQGPSSVPAVGPAGLALLGGALALFGVAALRRRQGARPAA